MAQLTEEVGEVARIISRRYGEQSEKESDKQKDLGEELADVLFVVICLANQTGVDLSEAFAKKLELKTKRVITIDTTTIKSINERVRTKSYIWLCSRKIQVTGSKSESNRMLLLQALFPQIELTNLSNF